MIQEREVEQEPEAHGYVLEAQTIDVHDDPDAVPKDGDEVLDALEGMRWRVAEALLALREQINALSPARDRRSDGTIGDSNHLKKGFGKSDHNPHISDGQMGVVTAMDVTHDPDHCPGDQLAAALHASRDPRIKYIIWNRRIANSAPVGDAPAWTWRTYTGANPHNHHVHLSVKGDDSLYDSRTPWKLALAE